MRFRTEVARLQHPEARLIPYVLWHNFVYFGGSFDESLIPFMTEPDISLFKKPLVDSFAAATVQQRECAWIAI